MTLFPGGYFFTQAKYDKKAKKAYEQNSHENCMAAAGAANTMAFVYSYIICRPQRCMPCS
jgi:hypothetical protein